MGWLLKVKQVLHFSDSIKLFLCLTGGFKKHLLVMMQLVKTFDFGVKQRESY